MAIKTNSNSVMSPKQTNRVLSTSPKQYAGANGSLKLTPKQIQSYHVSNGKTLGITKGKKVPYSAGFKKANTPGSTASTSRTLHKR